MLPEAICIDSSLPSTQTFSCFSGSHHANHHTSRRDMVLCCSRGLDESKARWFFQQLVLALDYCHKMNISNRDIKLENTLLHSQGQDRRPMVKLCDFGEPWPKFDLSSSHAVMAGELQLIVCLVDTGYSINEDQSLAKTAVGTPGYTGALITQALIRILLTHPGDLHTTDDV